MASFTFKVVGLKGLSNASKDFAKALTTDIGNKTITPIAQEMKARLEQDTPVVTGRLLRSTVLRKDSPTQQTVGQFAPYANVVNNRRGYWQGALGIAQKWPPFVTKTIRDEWAIMLRRYAGK